MRLQKTQMMTQREVVPLMKILAKGPNFKQNKESNRDREGQV